MFILHETVLLHHKENHNYTKQIIYKGYLHFLKKMFIKIQVITLKAPMQTYSYLPLSNCTCLSSMFVKYVYFKVTPWPWPWSDNAQCRTHTSYFHMQQYVQVSSGLNHYFLHYRVQRHRHTHKHTHTNTHRQTLRRTWVFYSCGWETSTITRESFLRKNIVAVFLIHPYF